MRWCCASGFELGSAEDESGKAVGVEALADESDALARFLEQPPAVVVEHAPPVHVRNAHLADAASAAVVIGRRGRRGDEVGRDLDTCGGRR
jgi:hypothetical protein